MSNNMDAKSAPSGTVLVWHASDGQPGTKRRRDTPPEHRHSNEEWERHRDRITKLFEENDLNDVVDIMAREGFEASASQYSHRLRNWGHWKYLKLTEKQWAYIGQSLFEREAEGKTNTAFRLNGKPVPSEKLDKGLKEKIEEQFFDLTLLKSKVSSGDLSVYTARTTEAVTVTMQRSTTELRHVGSGLSSQGSLQPLPEEDAMGEPITAVGASPIIFRRFFGTPSRQGSLTREQRQDGRAATPDVADLQEQLDSAKAKADALEKERDDLWQQLDALRYSTAATRSENLQEQLSSAIARAESAENQKDVAQQQLSQLSDQNDRMLQLKHSETESAKARVGDLEQERDSLKNQLETLTKKYRKLRSRNSELETAKTDLPHGLNMISEICRRFRSKGSEATSVKARVKAVEKERDGFQKRLAALTKKHTALLQSRDSDLEVATSNAREQVDLLQRRCVRLNKELEEAMRHVLRFERRAKNTQKDNEIRRNECDSQRVKLQEINDANLRLKVTLEEKDALLSVCEQKMKELQDEIEPLRRYKNRRSGPRSAATAQVATGAWQDSQPASLFHGGGSSHMPSKDGRHQRARDSASHRRTSWITYPQSDTSQDQTQSPQRGKPLFEYSDMRDRFHAQAPEQFINPSNIILRAGQDRDDRMTADGSDIDMLSLRDLLEDEYIG